MARRATKHFASRRAILERGGVHLVELRRSGSPRYHLPVSVERLEQMRSRRIGLVLVVLLVAAMLLGTGLASARPVQARSVPAGAVHTPEHCHPVVPDPGDV